MIVTLLDRKIALRNKWNLGRKRPKNCIFLVFQRALASAIQLEFTGCFALKTRKTLILIVYCYHLYNIPKYNLSRCRTPLLEWSSRVVCS